MSVTNRKTVTLLGATGSIGLNARRVLSRFRDRFRIRSLTCRRNWRDCFVGAVELGAEEVVIGDVSLLSEARRNAPAGLKVTGGDEAVLAAADWDGVDIVVSAISGAAGLLPTLAAVESGKRVALANKESMVLAGDLINAAAEKSGAEIIPVDSEHSAIFQCLRTGRKEEIDRLVLTASGGPLWQLSPERFFDVTPAEALAHPTWDMSRRITVDSATLMNKALELVEATRLFGVSEDRVDVYIHPQSLVHSMVCWRDGSIVAQLGVPDMRLPIQYALFHPERPAGGLPALNIENMRELTFEPPDDERFPVIEMARFAAREGNCYPAALNAADEVAVAAFLDGRLPLPVIFEVLQETLDNHQPRPENSAENILKVDEETRAFAEDFVVKYYGARA